MRNNPDLRESFEKINSPNILVIGDLMLDHYSWGEVDRISPEAPIPVMRVLLEENRLGGAGNAAINLMSLGAKVFVCGTIGNDENGTIIQKLLTENKADTSGVIICDNSKTCLKHRMIAGQNHLLRMDIDPNVENHSFQNKIIDFLEKTITKYDAILVSDYGKGFLNKETLEAISIIGKKHLIPIVGDPRSTTDYKIYNNSSIKIMAFKILINLQFQ